LSAIVSLVMERIIDFIKRDFMEEEVRVQVVGEAVKVPLYEGFVELSRGAEYSVPRWLANALSREGAVTIREEPVSLEKLSSIAYNEESLVKKLQLVKIPKYFYMLVSSVAEELQEKLKMKADVSLFEDYMKLEELYITIGRLRVRKILNFLLLPTVPQEVFEKLSEEEKALFNLLREALLEWMKRLRLVKA